MPGTGWGCVVRKPIWIFVRHYLEMIVAMLLGMALYPLWVMATSDARAESWVHRPDVAGIVMATAMSMPMVAWMVYRGHRALLTVEMVAAMFAGFLVLLPPLWVGAISAATFMVVGHIVMPLLMLLAMLARRGEYTHHHAHASPSACHEVVAAGGQVSESP